MLLLVVPLASLDIETARLMREADQQQQACIEPAESVAHEGDRRTLKHVVHIPSIESLSFKKQLSCVCVWHSVSSFRSDVLHILGAKCRILAMRAGDLAHDEGSWHRDSSFHVCES